MGLEDRRLVVLHVLRISERQALHRHRQSDHGAGDPARMAPDQLGRVGVALLRHDRGAGAEGVGQVDEAERLARPEDQLLGEAREVERALGRGHQIIEREVAVGDGIERVGAGPVEAQSGGGGVAVDREAGAGEGGGAERAFVQPLAGVGEARAVARGASRNRP